MAHKTIQLAAELEFTYTPRTWCVGVAEYVGWYEAFSRPVAVLRVKEPAAYSKLTGHVDAERLPEQIRERVPVKFARRRFAEKLHRDRVPVPIEVLICDVPHRMKADPIGGASRKVDGWQMREDFFRLTETTADLVKFLNRYGVWDRSTEPHYISDRITLSHEREWRSPVTNDGGYWFKPNITLPNELFYIDRPRRRSEPFSVRIAKARLVSTRSLFQAALTGKAEEWFDMNLSVTFNLSPRPAFPHFVIGAHTCFDVIRHTITVDHLCGTKFRNCARPDCGMPFPLESRHARIYCTQYCAHLESVRRNRQKKQEQ